MPEPTPVDPRRAVPRTDEVLADPQVGDLAGWLALAQVVALVREGQQRVRSGRMDPALLVPWVVASASRPPAGTTAVINATGVLLHTNLGRAPLTAAARRAVDAAAGATDVSSI